MSIHDLLSNGLFVHTFDYEATGIPSADPFITQIGYESYHSKTGVQRQVEKTIPGVTSLRTDPNQLTPEDFDLRAQLEADLRARGLTGVQAQVTDQELLNLPREIDYLEAHVRHNAGSFGKKQYESGAFESLVQAHRDELIENKVNPPNKRRLDPSGFNRIDRNNVNTGLSTVESGILGLLYNAEMEPGVVLGQNTNYEREVTNSIVGSNTAYKKTPKGAPNKSYQMMAPNVAAKAAEDAFGKDPYSKGRDVFGTDPWIADARKRMTDAAKDMKQAVLRAPNHQLMKDSAEVQTVLKRSQALEQAMVKAIEDSVQSGHSTLIDLMDLSKVLQAELIASGHLEARYFQHGTNMELLASTFLQETETHTALSDSIQQRRVFLQIAEDISNVRAGSELSDGAKRYIAAMNDPATHMTTYQKGLSNILEEAVNELEGQKLNQAARKRGEKPPEFKDWFDSLAKKIQGYTNAYKDLPEPPGKSRKGMLEAVLAQVQAEQDNIQAFMVTRKQAAPHVPVTPNPTSPTSIPANTSPTTNAQSTPNIGSTPKGSVGGQQAVTGGQAFSQSDAYANIQNAIQGGDVGKLLVSQDNSVQSSAVRQAAVTAKNTINPIQLAMYGMGAMVVLNILSKKTEEYGRQEQQNVGYEHLYNDFALGQGYADYLERKGHHKQIY